MKIKRIISVILILLLVCPTISMAAATRRPQKLWPGAVKTAPTRGGADDILFEDFTSVAAGVFPKGVTGGKSDTGYVTTEEVEVLPGYKKNCLVLYDTDSTDSYSGTRATIAVPETKGIIRFEARYKYIPTENNTHCALVMGLKGSKGEFSRVVVASSNGNTFLNFAQANQGALENARISHDAWYTLTMSVDFDAKEVEAMLKNETTGKVFTKYESGYGTAGDHTGLTSIDLNTQRWGGKYIFDYVRVTKTEESLSESEAVEIQKGFTPIYTESPAETAVSGRINIKLDGSYIYTTVKPEESTKGNLMASARNLAHAFGATYVRDGKAVTVTLGDKTAVFTDGLDKASVNGNSVSLTDASALKGNQLMVSAESFAKIFGGTYSFDKSAMEAVITMKGDAK